MRSALAVIVLFAALVAVPFATKERDYPASIPQPSPLDFTSLVRLPPGAEACLGDAVVEEHSEQVRFRVGTLRRPGTPLTVTIDGEGYSQRMRIPGGYPDNLLHAVPIAPPARATPVRICIANEGARRVDLYGAADDTRGRSRTEVDGRLVAANVVIGFWEREPRSIVERVPATAERIPVFRAAVVGEWLVWLLIPLFVIGVPVAALWGLRRSLRDEP